MNDAKVVKNTIDAKMLETMADPAMVELHMTVKIVRQDGTKCNGIFLGLVGDPLPRYEFRNILFIKVRTTKVKDDMMIVYVPVPQVNTIEWSY